MKKIIFLGLMALSLLHPAASLAFNMEEEIAHRVAFGSAKDVGILLDQGGDPNLITAAGTPLTAIAAARADGQALPVLQKLVEAGADLNQGGSGGDYPIIIAARTNNYELMKYLVDNNVNYEVTDRNGATPKQIAEYNNNLDIIALLSELEAKKQAELEARRRPERYVEFYNKLVFEYCAVQYLTYYVRSGQDKLSQEEGQIILSEANNRIRDIIMVLAQDFSADINKFEDMRADVQGKIYAELERLISNRNRKLNGIGKPSDMKKRCDKIGKKWLASAEGVPVGGGMAPTGNEYPEGEDY